LTPGAGIPMRNLVQIFNPGLYDILPDTAFNLLGSCLDLNFKDRITAEQALRHPFFDPILSNKIM
jgi:serine/threonine protein kinase